MLVIVGWDGSRIGSRDAGKKFVNLIPQRSSWPQGQAENTACNLEQICFGRICCHAECLGKLFVCGKMFVFGPSAHVTPGGKEKMRADLRWIKMMNRERKIKT